MPRVSLCKEQQLNFKANDFKAWVWKQMKLKGKRQEDVAELLGISAGRVSQMLKFQDAKGDKGRKVQPDPFSYGQVLLLCDYFEVSEEEKVRLLTL